MKTKFSIFLILFLVALVSTSHATNVDYSKIPLRTAEGTIRGVRINNILAIERINVSQSSSRLTNLYLLDDFGDVCVNQYAGSAKSIAHKFSAKGISVLKSNEGIYLTEQGLWHSEALITNKSVWTSPKFTSALVEKPGRFVTSAIDPSLIPPGRTARLILTENIVLSISKSATPFIKRCLLSRGFTRFLIKFFLFGTTGGLGAVALSSD